MTKSFQGGFEAGEEEKVCGGNIGAVWWLWHDRDVVFGQVVRHTEGCVARRIVVMEPPGLRDGWADADDAFSQPFKDLHVKSCIHG